MSEGRRTLARRVSKGGAEGDFNKNQTDKLEFMHQSKKAKKYIDISA